MAESELTALLDKATKLAAEEGVCERWGVGSEVPLTVAVVGSAGHGKSALINSLAGAAVLPVGIPTKRPVAVQAAGDDMVREADGVPQPYSEEFVQRRAGEEGTSLLEIRRSGTVLPPGIRLLELPAGTKVGQVEADAYLMVLDAGHVGGDAEVRLLEELSIDRPLVCVLSKADLWPASARHRAAAMIGGILAQLRPEQPEVVIAGLLPGLDPALTQADRLRGALTGFAQSAGMRATSMARVISSMLRATADHASARLQALRGEVDRATDLAARLDAECSELRLATEGLLRDADQVEAGVRGRAQARLEQFREYCLSDISSNGTPESYEEQLNQRAQDTWESIEEETKASYEAFFSICCQRLSKLGREWLEQPELEDPDQWPGRVPTRAHVEAPHSPRFAPPKQEDAIPGAAAGVLALATFLLPTPLRAILAGTRAIAAATAAGAGVASFRAGRRQAAEGVSVAAKAEIDRLYSDLDAHATEHIAAQFERLKNAIRETTGEPYEAVAQRAAAAKQAAAELRAATEPAIQAGEMLLAEVRHLEQQVAAVQGGHSSGQ